jgi:hypothetical protein
MRKAATLTATSQDIGNIVQLAPMRDDDMTVI